MIYYSLVYYLHSDTLLYYFIKLLYRSHLRSSQLGTSTPYLMYQSGARDNTRSTAQHDRCVDAQNASDSGTITVKSTKWTG